MFSARGMLKRFPIFKNFRRLNSKHERDAFVAGELATIPRESKVLDAGCGAQVYRAQCAHLIYKAQDFGKYTADEKQMFGSNETGGLGDFRYGELDYIGDIWSIDEQDEFFDAILCTEVFEHIPYPIETVKEFSRLLKPGGKLILTAPSNCLRHMDPYFYYSGFSDRWYDAILKQFGFCIESIRPVGDYYSWVAMEIARTASTHSIVAKLALAPAFVYYYLKKKTAISVDTLCIGYHVVARKID
jgi:SAM-dependent methyltransferase